MSNEKITQLPTVTNASLTDIIYAVQGYVSPTVPGTSVQETLEQVLSLIQSNILLSYAGNPNGYVAGIQYETLCWDTTNNELYLCTTSGSTTTAVWTKIANGTAAIITPAQGGTGVSDPTAHTIAIAEGASNFNFIDLTNGQLLIGSTGADPVAATPSSGTNITWATGAGTLTANLSGIVSSTLGGTGVSNPTAHGVMVAEGSSAINPITMTNGQLLIGSTGADPVPAIPTDSATISWTAGAGTLTANYIGSASPSSGGTGLINPTAHSILVTEGSSPFNLVQLTNGQLLIGSTGSDPVGAAPTNGTNISWSTGAGTLTANLSGTVSSTLGGSGVSNPTAHGILVAEGSSAFNPIVLTNGQLLIGSTGADPSAATLTAGTNISISNSAGGITISATGAGGFAWNHVTNTSASMASNNGYIADNAALVTLTLPTSSAIGDELEIVGRGAGGWTIAQGSGQQIIFGSSSTTSGVSGGLSSTNRRDTVYMVCTNANTEWTIVGSPQGNLTVV